MMSIQFKIKSAVLALAAISLLVVGGAAVADSKKEKSPSAQAVSAGDAAVKTPPENAALVNGKAIPYADYSKELDLYQRRSAQQGREIPEEMLGTLGKQILEQLVNNELLLQQSKKEGISINSEDVDKELASIKKSNPDQAKFEALLKEVNLTEEQLKQKISNNLAIRSLLEDKVISKIDITDQDAKTFYDENAKLFDKPEEVRARHILIGVDESAGEEEKAKARQKLADLKKRVDAGEEFAALAKEHSTCPSAEKGGDLGYFSKDRMVKPFSEAAFSMKSNEVSDIVETQFGYHLIKVLDHRDAGSLSFEEVKPRIIASLRNKQVRQKITAYISGLRDKAKIETFIQ